MTWTVVERFEAEDATSAPDKGSGFHLLGTHIAAWQREVEVIFHALYAVLEEMGRSDDG